MGTSKTMEFRPERSLKKISCLVLTLFIILIPKWTWAHSWAVQEPQEYFAKQLPLFIQTTERDLCPSETTLSSRCFLSLAKNSAKEITNVDSQILRIFSLRYRNLIWDYQILSDKALQK